jgi:hypothetical protein
LASGTANATLPWSWSSRIGDVPVLVARGRDERLRAFLPDSEQLLAHFQGLVREPLA